MPAHHDGSTNPFDPRPLAVTLVEDDPLQVGILVACLRLAGLGDDLRVFADGESALACLHGGAGPAFRRPDLILLDMRLPGMSGVDVLRAIRDDGHTCTIPVVALSNASEPDLVHRAYAAGANCFIEKRRTVDEAVAAMGMARQFFGGVVTLPPAPAFPPASRRGS